MWHVSVLFSIDFVDQSFGWLVGLVDLCFCIWERLLVPGDVHGSVEAILDVLETYDGDSACKLDLVHYGIGNVSETDVELADAFGGQYKSLL